MSSTIVTPTDFSTRAFEGRNVRILVENGALLFHLGDVLKAVESESEPSHTKKSIEEDYLLSKKVWSWGNNRYETVTFISELALVELLVSLRVPKAQTFKKWVVEEVTPSVLKAGKDTTGELIHYEAASREVELLGALARAFPSTAEWAQRRAVAIVKKASEFPGEYDV